MRGRTEPGAAIDIRAIVIARTKVSASSVQGYSNFQGRGCGPWLVMESSLDCDGPSHSIGRSREDGKAAVTLAARTDYHAVMPGNYFLYKGIVPSKRARRLSGIMLPEHG